MSLRDNIYQSSLTSLLGKYRKEIVQEKIYEHQVCRSAVIRVYKLEGGVLWSHVYSLMVIFFIVKRYDLLEIFMIFTEQISQIIANMGKESSKVRIDEYLSIIIIFDRGKLLYDTSSSGYELENRVSHTMLLVWKGKLKSENFLCYPCCCFFDLRAQCINPLSFNISGVHSHGLFRVYLHFSVYQLLQLGPDGDVCFYRFSTQLLKILISDSDQVEFHVFSLVVSLTNLIRSPIKLLRMRLNLVKMPQIGGILGYSYGPRMFDRGKDCGICRSGNYVYDLTLESGYCSELLLDYLCVFLLGIYGDTHNASVFGGEMTQIGNAHMAILRLQLTRDIVLLL
ncbi:uncharacterized protein LOC113318643 isoform X1 [Papaver somniferum]|uniref:uncharacterized protein LOC113318643 isoform X1 n=2 Tax=Papaver somniferum TaxID=3469 RepID=UPI000E6FF1CF|nr:uncharacterized protein LOC113318643 isoform X1 [Papaver somniferum]